MFRRRFRYFPSNIHGIERFWMGSLFAADSPPPVSGSGVLPLRDGLGRVTVLPQLKVDRLCSVVDGTAEFDPFKTLGRPIGALGTGGWYEGAVGQAARFSMRELKSRSETCGSCASG